MNLIVSDRRCGECFECCISLPIEDPMLNKKQGEKCRFCDRGCTIYHDKPESCTNFNCVYIEDNWQDMRPDSSGVIFEKITTKIFMGLVSLSRLDNWKTIQMEQKIKKLNAEGISVIIASFTNGITDVYTAPGHNRDKVVELSIRYTNGGTIIHN